MSDDIQGEQQLSDTHEKNAPVTNERDGADLSRRKFAKIGLVSAPVIMTLSSRSAFGAGYNCTISGLLSGNLSNATAPGSCLGLTPGYWKNHVQWPSNSGCYTGNLIDTGKQGRGGSKKLWDDTGTHFHDFFAGDKYMYDFDGNPKNYTMIQILWNFAEADKNANQALKDWYELGAHTVAAYLNAWASIEGTHGFGGDVSFGLTPQQVITLYEQNYLSSPEQVKVLFQMWNENNRDPGTLQGLLGL